MATDNAYNIARLALAAAGRHRNRTAIKSLLHSTTYGDLEKLIIGYAARLRSLGVGRASCVGVAAFEPVSAIVLPLACALLGCRWVFSTPAALAGDQLGVTHLVFDDPKTAPPSPRHLKIDPSWAAAATTKPEPFEGFTSPGDVWIIGQSSGTTGTPKFFPISAGNALARCDPRLLFDKSKIPVFASLFVPLHAGNYSVIIRVLLKGGTILTTRDYASWQANKATYVLGSPAQFAQILKGRPPSAAARIPLAWLGGGPIYAHFLKRMLEYFGSVLNTYGSAEAALVCARLVSTTQEAEDPERLGPPLPGTRIEIADDAGIALPVGTEGLVRVRTPFAVAGYIGDSAATGTIFRDGWFYPGDLGFMSDKDEFHFTGRANDQLNIGGVKINAALLDEIIQTTPGIKDGICFARLSPNGETTLAAVVALTDVTADARPVVAALKVQCLQQVGPNLVPAAVFVAAVPRNANGKATRHLAAEAVRGIEPISVSP